MESGNKQRRTIGTTHKEENDLKKIQIRRLDFLIYAIILLHTMYFLITEFEEGRNPYVYVSLLTIGVVSFIGSVHTSRNITIKRNVNIFSFIFFFIAPWQQYAEESILWKVNGLNVLYTDQLYLKTNIMIIIALFIFNCSYDYYTYRKILPKSGDENANNIPKLSMQSEHLLVFASSLSLVFLIFLNTLAEYEDINLSLSSQLQNMLSFIPVCSLIAYGLVYSNKKELLSNNKFRIILLIFAIIFFPFWGNMARFLLMGTYIVLLSLWGYNHKNKSLYFLLFYVGFVFFFSALRYANSIRAILNVRTNFNYYDFDAQQLMMTIIKYADEKGFVFGKNIVSALAFLIPRDIWSGKMINSGSIAVAYYGSWFRNVSCPLFGELYFAFGWFGVLIGSAAVSYIAFRLDGWSESLSMFKRGMFCIISGMTMYICRGSLLVSMAFTLSLTLVLWIMSMVVKIQIKRNHQKQNA